MINYILSFDPGTVNISYCLLKCENKTIPEIIDWSVFNIEGSTYEATCRKLSDELDRLNPLQFVDSDLIIEIEQQMGINTKTNRVSGMLFMYFVRIKCDYLKKIVHYAAKHKINYYQWKEGDPPPIKRIIKNKDTFFINERIAELKITKTNSHYRNKKIVEEHCKRILQHNQVSNKWLDYFNNSKKKDDLADCYIQGLSYFKFPSGNKDKNWLKDYKGDYSSESDKIINPETGKYVKKTGKIGKKLTKET